MLTKEVCYTYMESPVGRLMLIGNGQGLLEIRFLKGRAGDVEAGWQRDDAPFRKTIKQLEDYFDGRRREFDLVLLPRGTPFQLKVWEALRRIPYGQTISYAELARRIGKPKAVRAVGAANGQNPLSIVVPCHRVIGSDGSLTGYGGGIDNKEYLLALEGSRTLALPGDHPVSGSKTESKSALRTSNSK